MKIPPLQQYLALGVVLLAVILIGYYQYLWKPVNTEIQSLTVTRDQKAKDLEEAKRIVARYAEFKKQSATVQRELEWFEHRIPKTLETTRFIEALNILQQRSRVTFTSMNFLPVQAAESYVELPADVRFITDFQGLLTFLYRMSTAEIYLAANNLTITTAGAVGDDTIVVLLSVKGVMSK